MPLLVLPPLSAVNYRGFSGMIHPSPSFATHTLSALTYDLTPPHTQYILTHIFIAPRSFAVHCVQCTYTPPLFKPHSPSQVSPRLSILNLPLHEFLFSVLDAPHTFFLLYSYLYKNNEFFTHCQNIMCCLLLLSHVTHSLFLSLSLSSVSVPFSLSSCVFVCNVYNLQ